MRDHPLDRLIAAAEDMLRMGEHDGECNNDGDPDSYYIGPCHKHLEASERREAALRDAIVAAKAYRESL